MRYLILPVLGNEDHQELNYCLVPWCEALCRFVATEAHRFRSYMLGDRRHTVRISWQGLPALYWYESLPAAVAALAGEDGECLPETPDEFGEPLRLVDVPDGFAWPPSEGESDVLVLSNADFVREASLPQPNLWVLWSATLIEDGDGYDYHSSAVPLPVFEQCLSEP